MVEIPSEVIVACGEHKTLFSAQRIVIRVLDMAAGPFLAIEGIDDDQTADGENLPHCFYLQSEEEIDKFSRICKRILKQANEASNVELTGSALLRSPG
jgi:hypothetical protein